MMDWEHGLSKPAVTNVSAIVRFLGQDPRPVPTTFGERLRRWREDTSLSLRCAARKLGLNEETVVAWERGRQRPQAAKLQRAEAAMARPLEPHSHSEARLGGNNE
jgi:DNA-binding XRE family transcriptional regulator